MRCIDLSMSFGDRRSMLSTLVHPTQPLKLKAEGWLGTYALGSSYIALPWWCGHAMFNAGTIGFQEVILTILYSIGTATPTPQAADDTRPKPSLSGDPSQADAMAHCSTSFAAGLGIAIVNDFKSIEGDRKLGMNSLPVAFGIEKAKY